MFSVPIFSELNRFSCSLEALNPVLGGNYLGKMENKVPQRCSRYHDGEMTVEQAGSVMTEVTPIMGVYALC